MDVGSIHISGRRGRELIPFIGKHKAALALMADTHFQEIATAFNLLAGRSGTARDLLEILCLDFKIKKLI